MAKYEVEVTDPRDQIVDGVPGVTFHVMFDGHPKTFFISSDTLREHIDGQQLGGWTDFVTANHDLIQRLVQDGAARG